ncbi:PaaI family thioesterase [Microbacterium sp. C23T]
MVITDLDGLPADEQYRALNGWGTLSAQSIRIVDYAADFTRVRVRLDLTSENANYMGTAFGGSLFSMIDPFLVVMAKNQLGSSYVVWDKAAEITFVAPGVGPVEALIELNPSVVEEIRLAASDGAKVLRWFDIDVRDTEDSVVASVRRQLYVRERRESTAP